MIEEELEQLELSIGLGVPLDLPRFPPVQSGRGRRGQRTLPSWAVSRLHDVGIGSDGGSLLVHHSVTASLTLFKASFTSPPAFFPRALT